MPRKPEINKIKPAGTVTRFAKMQIQPTMELQQLPPQLGLITFSIEIAQYRAAQGTAMNAAPAMAPFKNDNRCGLPHQAEIQEKNVQALNLLVDWYNGFL